MKAHEVRIVVQSVEVDEFGGDTITSERTIAVVNSREIKATDIRTICDATRKVLGGKIPGTEPRANQADPTDPRD